MCDTKEFCRSSRDSTIGINFDALGEVEHFDHLSGDFFDLYKSQQYADVTFLVVNNRFPAHRVVLAARCEFFRCLLFGDMKEAHHQSMEIEIPDTTPEAFAALLQYVYCGRICLGDLPEQVTLDLVGLANKYSFLALQQSIISYLKAAVTVANVCLIFSVSSYYQLKELNSACTDFIDLHATEVMKSDGFLSLSQSALVDLVSRDSFYAPEMDIYHGILQWVQSNEVDVKDAKELLKAVRLQLIPMADLLEVIRKSGFFDAHEILDAISMISQFPAINLHHRGLLLLEENVATPQRGASTIEGQVRDVLLNSDSEMSSSGEQNYTTHVITGDSSKGITVQLSQPYIINCIRMLLWDRDNRSYSYFIEVSLDKKNWQRVVDRTNWLCRSWQELFFEPLVIRYLRVVGVYNSVNRTFHLVSFSCLYTSKPFLLASGLIIPTENVASVAAGATVVEGVSRSRNALLNGNTREYDWDSGYTCHQLGCGAILVQLAQPYIVSSMRLLLWDKDDRSYSYYVEVSTDQKKWAKVVDKTQECCRSWQPLTFERCPVAFIKIVGTRNTANEVFHLVHLECPASTSAPSLPSFKQSSSASN